MTKHKEKRPLVYKEPRRRLHPLVYTLRKRRYELGMTSNEVADHIGYDIDTLQSWEFGGYLPSFRAMEVWAMGLGLKLELVEMK